jgi:RimJ/RimL family protein N-acetyltransferase
MPSLRATLSARNGSLLQVEELSPAHLAGLQAFNAGLSVATRAVFLPHAYDAMTLERYEARHRAGRDRAYVLRAAETVVGYGFLWEFDQLVPLLGLGLADAWQGQGLGAPFLRILINDAETAGRHGVELTTVTTNTRALRLYQRAGFVLRGEVDNRAGDGRVVREYRLFLPLRAGAQPPDRAFGPPA